MPETRWFTRDRPEPNGVKSLQDLPAPLFAGLFLFPNQCRLARIAMSNDRKPLMVRLLQKLSDAVCTRPGWFVWPQVLLLALSVWYTVHGLKFDLDRNALVGSDQPYHRNFLALKDEFPGQDDLVCVVESESIEKNRQFVEKLGQRLENLSTLKSPTNLFTDVFYKGDLKMLGPKALLFIPEDQLGQLKDTLGEYRPFIEKFSNSSNLTTLFQLINATIRATKGEGNAQTDSLLKALPALTRILQRATESLDRAGAPVSPGVDALFGAGEEAEREKYVAIGNGRIFLVTAKARTEDLNSDAVDKFREVVAEVGKEVPGVNVGVTGEPVLEYDEMSQSQKDSTKASIVSLLVCAAIFVIGYRGTGRPLKAVLCLVFGLGYTMGYTTLVVGHLNILTITFVPMLIGLAIDYGVHLITRYEEELRRGRSERAAMDKAIVYTGQGIFTGCFTTAGAFFAMSLTNFQGIKEMGLITGGGMVICLIPMLTLLPVLLMRGKQNLLDEKSGELALKEASLEGLEAGGERVDARARLEQLWLDRPWAVIGVTASLCIVAALFLPKVRFDYNLLNMQSDGLAAVLFEHKLVDSSEKSVLYGAVVATNLEEAVRLEQQLTNLPSVHSSDSMSKYLAERSDKKLALIREIKATTAPIVFPEPDPAPANLKNLGATLFYFRGYMLNAKEAVEKELQTGSGKPADTNLLTLATNLTALIEAEKGLELRLSHGDSGEQEMAAEKIGKYQAELFRDIRDTFETLKTQDASGGLRAEDLPASLRNRFIGRTGKYLIQVYPKMDVWERGPQEVFVKELQTVAPKVTGTPVQLYYYTELLRTSYIQAAWWALGAIILLVLFHFRRMDSVVLSLIPVAIGTLWVVGFMGATNLAFNPANIMMLPLVIGIGVTNGIHILNRYAEEQNPGILAKSTGKAVLVSGLNTIAGFGSLILAEHRGIRSLGWIMLTGTAACMIAGLTFLPAVLALREARARKALRVD